MKTSLKIFTTLLFLIFSIIAPAQIAINSDGSTPDASAMLEITSSDKGILIPRMDSTSRKNIANPAVGLMVFDSTTNSFWYYANSAWNNINIILSDVNGDTKIQVEESSNDDIIRFDMNGTEFMKLDSGRIEILNTGSSIFIGEDAGQNDDFLDRNNVYIGHQAGKNSTAGEDNVFVGYQAGLNNTTGEDNVFVGLQAGLNNTTGEDNIFVGLLSGSNNISGINNSYLGSFTGWKNTTGNNNTFLGGFAGVFNTTGENNTFLGRGAGYYNITGNDNIFIGYQAGYNETGSNKLYIENSDTSLPLIYGDFDRDSLQINGDLTVTGSITGSNIAFISENGIITSSNNDDDFVIGADSLNHGTGTEDKFFFDKGTGAIRGGSVTGTNWDNGNLGTSSIGLGYNNLASGNYSVALGRDGVASGGHSVALGRGTEAPSFAEIAVGTYNTTYTPTATGYMNDNDRLFVIGNGTAATRSDAMIVYKDGSAWIQGDLTVDATLYTSDIRLKENITTSQYGLEDILNIKVRDYEFKKDETNHLHTGFLAQQLHTVFPHAVHKGGEDENTNPWSVDYASLTPLLVKGMQEQQTIIDAQKNRIETLETQVAEINNLKKQVAEINELKSMLLKMQAQLEANTNSIQSAE